MPYLLIILAHFVGDWLLQSREIATNKSSKFTALLKHGAFYGAVMLIVAVTPIVFPSTHIMQAFIWLGLNVTIHMVQDWYYWSIIKKFGSKSLPENYQEIDVYKSKMFWDAVGFDQTLHYTVLFVSYMSLIQ